jgi:tetratricopeptide (TPR) repeat protein
MARRRASGWPTWRRWRPASTTTARFKYIRAPRPELYDLRGDPAERRDLAAAKPEVVARLDRLLSQRLGAAAAPRADARLAVGLGEADRARLRSLGYVAPARAAAAAPSDAVGGPDPKDEIGVLQVLREAQKDTDAGRLGAALERLAGVENGGTAAPAMRAAIAVATGDYALAERDARSVLGRQPDRPDILIILGRALAGQGRLAEARAAFEAAALLDPGSSTAHTYLGRVYEGLDRPDAAADAYARARRANPAASEPTWRLAVLLLKRGSVALADAVLAALPPERPLSPAAVVSLAQAEANAGRREAAGRRLAQALARDPGDPRLVRASDALRGASREPRPSP